MEPGQEAQFKGEVATHASGETAYGDWVDVSQRPEQTKWSSDNNAVATVNPETGFVKALSPGVAKITVQWKNGTYWLTDSVDVAVGDVELPPTVGCTKPIVADTKTGEAMNPEAVGVIKADARGQERFDVLKGIPTSESLYGTVKAKEYLFQNKFNKMTGTCTFNVPVTKEYYVMWREVQNGVIRHMSDNEYITRVVPVTREYSYWTVDTFQAYELSKAILNNYAFKGNSITILPAGYEPPEFVLETFTEHVKQPEIKRIELDMGEYDCDCTQNKKPDVPEDVLKDEMDKPAQARTPQLDVRNDKLSFEGDPIMEDAWKKRQTSDPDKIPEPRVIGDNVLYSPNHVIPTSKTNKQSAASTGTIFYSVIHGSMGAEDTESVTEPINEVNPVTVHTPVVMYPGVSNDKEHNQKVYPTSGRAALILDRSFTVTIPTSGPHREIKGYGNRDYAKYTAYKQVLFEFDVFNEDKGKYIPANTWIDIPVTQLETTFQMPVWVDEGKYTVHFRSIAENAPENFTWQSMANLDLTNHVAINTVPVEVIGRLYDFKVTDIADYDWETVFRTKKGSSEPTGAAYWVGPNSIDGAARGNKPPFILPILPGSHPNEGYKNVAIKTGYHFKFDFKTKGNNFGPKDHVKVVPTFYFVNKDGTKRQKVDLYYHNQTTGQKFVKIGSSQDTVTRSIVLNSPMRNVSSTELSNTAKYVATYGFTDFMKQASKKGTIGSYSLLDLNPRIRTLIGPTSDIPKTVDPGRAVASIQKWYGEYSLPAAPYAVPAGFNIAEYGRTNKLSDNSPIFLKDGYIVVNFNIETYQDGSDTPHLRYYRLPGDSTPLDNQWQLEGYSNVVQDKYDHEFAAPDGDVAYYHGNLSSYDDFRSSVTH
ncbi:DUF5704 domain-containing protein [Paenibacillus jiagnxiensis]|uniref:DUF5704 domain-containing protein n=1 Tax=Paenibacillus jiagnxiensis TaxID=3228926 RepID=UPI0034883AC2